MHIGAIHANHQVKILNDFQFLVERIAARKRFDISVTTSPRLQQFSLLLAPQEEQLGVATLGEPSDELFHFLQRPDFALVLGERSDADSLGFRRSRPRDIVTGSHPVKRHLLRHTLEAACVENILITLSRSRQRFQNLVVSAYQPMSQKMVFLDSVNRDTVEQKEQIGTHNAVDTVHVGNHGRMHLGEMRIELARRAFLGRQIMHIVQSVEKRLQERGRRDGEKDIGIGEGAKAHDRRQDGDIAQC